MKRLLVLILLISGVARAQTPPKYTKISQRYEWLAGKFNERLGIPVTDTLTAPLFLGEVRLRTADNGLYYCVSLTGQKWVKAGGGSGVTSVNASASGALGFSGGPVTASGTLLLEWQGLASQYVRGNGTLGDFFDDVSAINDSRYSLSGHTHISSEITDLTTTVRNLFSAGSGINYNAATGVISWPGTGVITSLNGLSADVQTFVPDGNISISSVGTAHTFNVPFGVDSLKQSNDSVYAKVNGDWRFQYVQAGGAGEVTQAQLDDSLSAHMDLIAGKLNASDTTGKWQPLGSYIQNQYVAKQAASAWIDKIKVDSALSPLFGTVDSVRALRGIVNGKSALYIGVSPVGFPDYPGHGTSLLTLGYRAAENLVVKDYLNPIDPSCCTWGRNSIIIGGEAGLNLGRKIDPDSANLSVQSTIIIGSSAATNLQYGYSSDYGRATLIGTNTNYMSVYSQGAVAVGAYSMERASKTVNNTVVGTSALRSIVNGSYNTIMGNSAGYKNTGSIAYATVTSGGTGYTTATVTISAPRTYGTSTMPSVGEVQATAHAVISGGVITAIVIDDPGGGYSSTNSTNFTDGSNNPPTVTITGDGTGAVATVTVTNSDYNTYIGNAANWFYRSGQYNTALGANVGNGVGRYADTGTTLIGAQAQVDASIALNNHLINATAIGWKAKIAQSNTVVLGDSAQATKTGIGTKYPDSTLTVVGSARISRALLLGGDLYVNAKGTFSDTLTATTMGVSDSSNRAASTAWVKQQGYGSGTGGSYTLPTASASVLGGVKVGSGLAIDGSGVLSATGGGLSGLTTGYVPYATSSTGIGNSTLQYDAANNKFGINTSGYNSTAITIRGKGASPLTYSIYAENSGGVATFWVTDDGMVNAGRSTVSSSQSLRSWGWSSFENYIQLKEITTPSTPSAGYQTIYPKTDGLYIKNSAGTETKLGKPTLSKSTAVEFIASTDSVDLFYTPVAITVTKVADGLRGTSPSVSYDILFASDMSSATPFELFGTDRTLTSTTGTTTTTFADATIPAGSFLWLKSSANGGTVRSLNLTIIYTED